MDKELKNIKKNLGVNEWLNLIKEDKNLNGGYISIAQYIWKLEKALEDEILNKEIAQGHKKQVQIIEAQERKELEHIKKKKEQILELLTHFDSGQLCDHTKSLAIEIEKIFGDE